MVGSTVWLFCSHVPKGKSPKLLQKWVGPYSVIYQGPNHTFKLRRKFRPQNSEESRTCQKTNLKKLTIVLTIDLTISYRNIKMLYSILKNWTTKIQNATNKMKNNRNHFLRTKQTKSLNIAYTKGSQLQDQIQRCSSNFMARRKPNPKSLKGHLPFPL